MLLPFVVLKAKLCEKESRELHLEDKIRLLESQYEELVAAQKAAADATLLNVSREESFSAEAERLEWLQERQRLEKEAGEAAAKLEEVSERARRAEAKVGEMEEERADKDAEVSPLLG